MKTVITILSASALLTLGACAKHDDVGANAASEQTTANVEEFGNDSSFASENVILPQENATVPDTADLNTADLNTGSPVMASTNTN